MHELTTTVVTAVRQQDVPYIFETIGGDVCSPRKERSMQRLSRENTIPLDFPQFPKLPYELRREIWLYSHPDPRDVVLDKQLPSICSPFAHLLTNHEARAIFVENYTRMFKGYPGVTSENGWYFNPRKDTLCLDSGLCGLRLLLQMCPDDARRVKFLDIDPSNGDLFYGSTENPSKWPRGPRCDVSLRDIPLELLTIRHFPLHRKFWTHFKKTVLILRRVLQHEQTSTCDQGKCTRLAIRIDHDNKEYDNEEGWGRHTFCKIHDDGTFDSHTCIDLELFAYDHDPFGGPWNQWNAKGFDVHLPEKINDGTLPVGTREIDLHKYTACDGEVLPIVATMDI